MSVIITEKFTSSLTLDPKRLHIGNIPGITNYTKKRINELFCLKKKNKYDFGGNVWGRPITVGFRSFFTQHTTVTGQEAVATACSNELNIHFL